MVAGGSQSYRQNTNGINLSRITGFRNQNRFVRIIAPGTKNKGNLKVPFTGQLNPVSIKD